MIPKEKEHLMIIIPIALVITFLIQLIYIAYITTVVLSKNVYYDEILTTLAEEQYQISKSHMNEINDLKNEISRIKSLLIENGKTSEKTD